MLETDQEPLRTGCKNIGNCSINTVNHEESRQIPLTQQLHIYWRNNENMMLALDIAKIGHIPEDCQESSD